MKYLNLLFAFILFSCSSRSDRNVDKLSVDSKPSGVNKVQLSDEQFKSIGIQLGSLETRSLSGNIKAHGVLDVPPQNLVSISAPLGGFVKSTELLQGMRVKKGQVVVVLEHPDYFRNKHAALILTGGNVDIKALALLFS